MAWFLLATAILVEVVATSFLPRTEGITKILPTILVLSAYMFAFYLLAKSLKYLEVGVAYAIWAGAGTAVVAVAGVLFLGESFNLVKVLGVAFIIGGVLMVNLAVNLATTPSSNVVAG